MAHASSAASVRDDLGSAIELARRTVPTLPVPGSGSTSALWETLATIGAVDLSVARAIEPHADARAILAEGGLSIGSDSDFWGVYAAEAPGVRLEAREDDGWVLAGTKPWCSLAARADRALVTAWVDDSHRRLFAVDLHSPGIAHQEGGWSSRGLRAITSGAVEFEGVPADPVGDAGWYLRRDGFAWGGMGVAAIWYGGAVGIARRILAQTQRRQPDQLALMYLGAADLALSRARSMLAEAAGRVDAGRADAEAGATLALRVRGVVAETVDEVLQISDHALGPAPLTQEEDHARRVADLRVYVRQHHAERDSVALGDAVLGVAEGDRPW